MSREIKFRAWNETRNKMFYQGKDFEELSLIDGEYKPVLNNSIENAFNWYKEKTILIQDTGLKDKNDKEIYEGDIVKIIRFARYNSELKTVLKTSTCEVIFDKLQYLFHDTYKDDFIYKFADIEYSYNGVKDIEVIGNIYENKELLE